MKPFYGFCLEGLCVSYTNWIKRFFVRTGSIIFQIKSLLIQINNKFTCVIFGCYEIYISVTVTN